jgi:hypothetical protein
MDTKTDLKEMRRIFLIVEYSRMQVPSLSRGCEIAHFLFATVLMLSIMSSCEFDRHSGMSQRHADTVCLSVGGVMKTHIVI